MRRLTAAAAATAAIAFAVMPVARATPADKLAEARDRFRAGDYKSVIATVYPLLFPTPALATDDELREAYVMLGVSYFETDDLDEAERWFEEALILQPDLELDPDVYTPKVVDFFRKIKRALRDKLEKAEKDRQLARYQEALARATQVNVQHNPYWINFIPFGAGQFQNGQPGKGKFFAIAEVTTGAASLGSFLVLAFDYGFPRHRIPRDEVGFAANLQRVQVGAGIAFVALYTWGVIDALLEHRPTVVTTTRIDPSLLPEGFPAPPQSAAPRVIPFAGPRGAGAVFHVEF
ncbi:MAG: tetratricopeptide repeat protein [Deltaproteobacteria bacterium]|nr:MAG: tetratricopeptide repeat protein [Deltaproteobacteria bacterium]